MKRLRDASWLDEAWARKVRDAMRLLVCHYVEAYEAVDSLKKPLQFVRLGGLSGGRRLLVFKPLLRDAVASHIETVLGNLTQLNLRAYRAARPSSEDLRLGVTCNASPERMADKKLELAKFIATQESVSVLLEEAVRDAKELRERVGNKGEGGARIFKRIVGIVRNVVPIAWAGWVVLIISGASEPDSVQFAFYVLGALIGYHAIALLGLPFHDAAERKHALFEGYLGKPSDGVAPLAPPISRFEIGLYQLFGSQPPCVIQWNQVVPLLHYAIAIALVGYAAWALPLLGQAKTAAMLVAGALIALYLYRLLDWWRLVRSRSHGQSVGQIVWALFAAIQPLQAIPVPDGDPAKAAASSAEQSD